MAADGVLALSCPERPGITHATTSLLIDAGLDIVLLHPPRGGRRSGTAVFR